MCSENNRNTGASLLPQNNYVIHIPHAKSFPPSYRNVSRTKYVLSEQSHEIRPLEC